MMLRMTAIPPIVITARASRSKKRRQVRLVEGCARSCRGAWPYTPAAGDAAGAGSDSLVKPLEFLVDCLGLQGEKSIFGHDLLTFLTIDKFDEFLDHWIQRFIRRLVDVEVEIAPDGVRPITCILLGGLFIRHAVFLRQGNGANVRRDISNAAITDAC